MQSSIAASANAYHAQLQYIMADFEHAGMTAEVAKSYATWAKNWEALAALQGVVTGAALQEKQRVWGVRPVGAPNSIARALQDYLMTL
jgi:hypothetical protein